MTAVVAFPTCHAHPQPRARSNIRLGMPHLAPDGLSEQWLLRECGDRHWSLIAETMGQDRATFTTADGRPLYAAFCATSLELAPDTDCLLGKELAVVSDIFRVSAGRIGSSHRFMIDGKELGHLQMISTFVTHDGSGSNRRIVRRQPARDARLSEAPAPLLALSDWSRSIARELHSRTARSAPLLQALPCPQLDFNAVGLLYFPTFSRLAETAEWQAGLSVGALAQRRITYLGNIDRGDSVSVHSAGGGLDIVRSDGEIIAHIDTRRFPN